MLMWLAGALPSEPAAPRGDARPDWRRTTHGWERLELQRPPPEPVRHGVHPAVVAGLEILLALAALAGEKRWGRQ